MKTLNRSGLLTAATGLLVILTPNVIFPVCEGLLTLVNGKEVPMRCFWTARAELLLGGLVLLAGLVIAFTKSQETRKRLNLQVIFLGLAVILTPLFIIPTCNNPDMACNVGTKPALILLGAITMLLGFLSARGFGSEAKTPELQAS